MQNLRKISLLDMYKLKQEYKNKLFYAIHFGKDTCHYVGFDNHLPKNSRKSSVTMKPFYWTHAFINKSKPLNKE